MKRQNEIGSKGEDLAAEYLMARGYAIAERNWRSGHYEIDIIAYHRNRIVFVEVKTRSAVDENPLEAIDRRKLLRTVNAALAYVEYKKINHDIQFDVIAINGDVFGNYTIEHVPDAFMPPFKTY